MRTIMRTNMRRELHEGLSRMLPGSLVGLALFALGALSLSLALRAQDAGSAPGRAVRLSSVDGRVQVTQGNQMLADPALPNTPLFEGTQVTTLDDGKAEIQFEEGSIARISPNSSLTLTTLKPDDGAAGTDITMNSGLGYFELQAGSDPGHIVVRFADATVTVSGFTVIRIDLDNPPGELAVFSGNAHLERDSALSLDLHGGESVALNATNPSQYNLAENIEPDSWDAWNSDRDQALNAEESDRTAATNSFANNQNPAWSDLDANGNWYNVPGQGYVWSPYDASAPGWDPYGNGDWMYNPAFGYSWISGDSWGYMPFSCGLWNYYSGFGWGWAPGVGPCMPWWGGGVFVPNIGFGPPGYLPPRLPRRPPVHPPVRGGRIGAYPLVAVNKRPPSGGPGTMPRDRNVSATIAGHVVMPLHALSPRPQYDHSASAFVNRGSSSSAALGVRTPNGGYTGAAGAASRPAPKPSGGSPHVSAPSHASAPPPASHPSGGGGGGAHH
jgi:hypothetical protein